MTQSRILLCVFPTASQNEWQLATDALAEALHLAEPELVQPVRAAPSGWVRPNDRAPVPLPGPDDIVFLASVGWEDPAQLPLLEAARYAGAKIVSYVHDITPTRRPEWFAPEHTARFTAWIAAILRLSQMVIVPSSATARDLDALRRRLDIVDYGTKRIRPGDCVLPRAVAQSPVEGRFVLVCAPIDVRIGHASVLSTWRRLATRLDPGELPPLVLAGRAGGLTGDLQQRLARDLPDVVVRLEADAAERSALLDACLFAIHPAALEGWGFAVSESLARGKPVFAANSGGLPEAGQRQARYFDPLDPDDIARNVERTLRDPQELPRWQREIAQRFRPRGWDDMAQDVLVAISGLV